MRPPGLRFVDSVGVLVVSLTLIFLSSILYSSTTLPGLSPMFGEGRTGKRGGKGAVIWM